MLFLESIFTLNDLVQYKNRKNHKTKAFSSIYLRNSYEYILCIILCICLSAEHCSKFYVREALKNTGYFMTL